MTDGSLSPASVRAHLPADTPCRIDVLPECTSTNAVLRARAEAGEAAYSVLIAKRQSAGRGRLGRSFYSPDGGGLYMSILLRPALPAAQSLLLTTAAAVAVAEAVEAMAGARASIKWVNDVYLRGHKVCGILTEAASGEDGALTYAIVGIGVNVLPPSGGFPDDLSGIAGSVLAAQKEDAVAALAADILTRFLTLYRALPDKGFLNAYRERSMLLGARVNVCRDDALIPALAVAVDDDFRLVVRYEDGAEEALSSGEVSVRPIRGGADAANFARRANGGANAAIPAGGANAAIPVGGANAAIPVGGADAAIPVGGANAAIPTGGADAAISVGGANAAIPVGGANAAIPVGGADAAIPVGGANAATEKDVSPTPRRGELCSPASASPDAVPRFSLRRISETALMTAALCVLSQLAIPMPSGVPLTLQTFAVALCGALLGARSGALCVALYLALGAVGLPVFSNLTGGIAKFVSPTGGFLIGFLPMAAFCGLRANGKRAARIALALAGLLLCHLCGALYFAYLTHTAPLAAISIVSLPYLLKDAVSVLLAQALAEQIRKRLFKRP